MKIEKFDAKSRKSRNRLDFRVFFKQISQTFDILYTILMFFVYNLQIYDIRSIDVNNAPPPFPDPGLKGGAFLLTIILILKLLETAPQGIRAPKGSNV